MNPSREYLCACGQTWTSRSLLDTARHRCADGVRRTGHLAAGQPASEPAPVDMGATDGTDKKAVQIDRAQERGPPPPSVENSQMDVPSGTDATYTLDVEPSPIPGTISPRPSKPTSKPTQGWPKRTLSAKASAGHTADIALAARAVAGQVSLSEEREAELIARLWANSIDTRYDALTATCPAWLNVLTTTTLTIGLTVFRKAPELRRVIKLPKKPAPVDPSLGVRT